MPGTLDDWDDLPSALARLWAARDPDELATAAAYGALTVPGVIAARFADEDTGPLARVVTAGAWTSAPARRTGRRRRDGDVVPDRVVRAPDGTVVATLSVQTAADGDRLAPQAERVLDTLAAQTGHVLAQFARTERVERFQRQFRTERVRAVHHEALWQVAFDEAPIGMAMISLAAGRAGDVLKVNDTFCRMARRTAAQLRSASLVDLVGASDGGPLSGVLHRAVAGRRTSATLVLGMRTPGGGSLPIRITLSPVVGEDGAAAAAICHIEDLSVRENARDEPGARREASSGLLTQASFGDALGRIHHRALRAGVSTGVLLCDLGLVHEAVADLDSRAAAELRAELARQVQTVLRPDDAVGQLDATTIGVALAELSTSDAQAIAGRIHAAITRVLDAHGIRPDAARTSDEPIAIAMIDPGVSLGAEMEAVVDRARTTLRSSSRRGAARPHWTSLEPAPGTKIILWERPDPGTQSPPSPTRVTLWQRSRPT